MPKEGDFRQRIARSPPDSGGLQYFLSCLVSHNTKEIRQVRI